MDRPLHLLIVDDRPDSVYLLSEFLLKRQHRVEVSSDGRESLAAVLRRRQRGDPYDLVLANVRLRDLDGLAMLRELRAKHDPTPIVLIDAFADVDAVAYREAEQLGCLCFLDKPIDLQRVEQLLGQVRGPAAAPTTERVLHGSDQFATRPRTTTSYRPSASGPPPVSGAHAQIGSGPHTQTPARDEPFFGTARVARPPTGTDRYPKPGSAANPFTESFPAHPAAGGGSDPHASRNGAFTPGRADTSRLRRTVTGRLGPDQPATPGPASAGNQVRTGALERRVVCAACRREFLVAYRDHEFTVNCVHCGQLNRVQPRAAR